jgi:3-deoxy-D-manno-octulosonate 8-phosphate phosphatase (KDO 8-P phosphatase)
MIIMDVDGTLTDGTIFVLPEGEELKGYHVRDGMGILMAHVAGFQTGIITGKTSKALVHRAKRLKMAEIHQGVLDKKTVLHKIADKHQLELDEIAYVGDDLGDLSVINSVGLSAAVADAHPEVKKHSHFACSKKGGQGAVREFIELILEAQGHSWKALEEKIRAL